MDKIEFDLELYNSGEYDVVTREGLPVKIAGVDDESKECHKVIGWAGGYTYGWSLSGRYTDKNYDSPSDLFLIPKKKIIKGWANVYVERGRYELSIVRETKEDAIKAQGHHNAIGLVYIETELIPNK